MTKPITVGNLCDLLGSVYDCSETALAEVRREAGLRSMSTTTELDRTDIVHLTWVAMSCREHWWAERPKPAVSVVEPVIKEVVFLDRGYVTIRAVMSNGEQVDVLRFYEDEISFSRSELIGKTKAEAKALFHKKDVAYLRS